MKTASKQTASKPAAAKRAGAKPAAKKPAATKKPAAKATTKASAKPTGAKAASRKPVAKPAAKPAKRADLGSPIDGFFRKLPEPQRTITLALRKLIESALPAASSAIKWGQPMWTIDDSIVCAIGAHKGHVNLILSGPPGTFVDPDGHLTGDGKTGRHLKVTSATSIPTAAVKCWIQAAAAAKRDS